VNAAEHLLGETALARHGERLALLCGDEALTYAELADRARRAAAALYSLGVQPGDRVLLLMRDTPEFAAAWLGAVRTGAVVVALNSRLSEAEYRHVLRDSAARFAILEDVFADACPDLTAELAREGRIAVAGAAPAGVPSWRNLMPNAQSPALFDAPPDSTALCLYSSGTTGRPKGIPYSHRAVLSVGQTFRELGIGEGDRVFTTSKFFFAYGLEHGLLAPLAMGMTSILCAEWPVAESVIGIVERHRPAAMFSVPTIYRRLLAEPPGRLESFRRLRRFVAGGERLSPQLVEQWKRAVGGEILNLYGMSETFCACMITPPGTSDGERTGKPMALTEVELRDERGAAPPAGAPGVLWVRHPAMARGYLNLPEQTREQFRDGWFCSRDMFVRDEAGFFVHQGRSDELLKVAGQWVRPSELEEAVALEADVAEAACVPVLDADGLQRLALFVTARGDAAQAERAAAAACERVLPRFKRPNWIRAVAELPRTATGKVQRFKLREMLERELSRKD
jgi:benzoate-CoA ligase